MRKTVTNINHEKLDDSTNILRALAHPLRMKILQFIDKHDSINVNKIYNTLKLEQSITSQHLKVLRLAGLVRAKKDGKYMHYSLDYDKIGQSIKAIRKFLDEDY
jgi:ArsR family transcriptional regulator